MSELIDKLKETRDAFGSSAALQERSHEALYDALAKLVGFTRMSIKKEHFPEFKALCDNAGYTSGDNKLDNIYIPYVGIALNSKKTKMPASGYKWAKILRYMMDNGIDEDDVVDTIKDAAYEKKSKLDAIIAMDSEKHQSTRGSGDTKTPAIASLKQKYENNVLAKLPPNLNVPVKVQGLTVMLGSVQDNGAIYVTKLFDRDEDELKDVLLSFAEKKDKGRKGKSFIDVLATMVED